MKDHNAPRARPKLDCSGDRVLTRQSFRDQVNINNIVNQYVRTGVLPLPNRRQPAYGDATGIDFQTAMQNSAVLKSEFAKLPAEQQIEFGFDAFNWANSLAEDEIRSLPGYRAEPEAAEADGKEPDVADPQSE